MFKQTESVMDDRELPKTVWFCGIRLDPLNEEELIELIQEAQTQQRKLLILNHNLHSLYLYETNAAFRQAYAKASCVYIDGMPVVWLARAAGLAVDAKHRITFLDSFGTMLKTASERGWRVFYLGSTEDTLRLGMAKIKQLYPTLAFSGRNGYLGKNLTDAPSAICEINAFRPDLLFVGMGMPLQETFLHLHLDKLHVAATLTSGATLDYIAGTAYVPPTWAGPLGLYGICRLLADPRRLWKRYLLEPVVLLGRLSHRVIRQRSTSPSAG